MRLYTSYFYQVRFFAPYEIPLSTAKSDPKWFHNFKDQSHIFLDKRGVVNGVRFDAFVPHPSCHDGCHGYKSCMGLPTDCSPMRDYRRQLDTLDFPRVMAILEETAQTVVQAFSLDREPTFIFLVHEAPDTICSERFPIQEWFASHGVDVQEWTRPFIS